MSAPRQSSPVAFGLEQPCSILHSLSDTSALETEPSATATSTKTSLFQEELREPEDDPCLPCLAGVSLDIEEETHYPNSKQSQNIAQYVAKIREAIQQQGERLQEEEGGKKDVTANEGVDFHIKVVKKHKPAPLLLNAKVRGNDLFSKLTTRAKRVRFAVPSKDERSQGLPKVQTRKRLSLPSLSSRKRFSSIFPPVQSKLKKPAVDPPKIKIRSSARGTRAPSVKSVYEDRYVTDTNNWQTQPEVEVNADEESQLGEDVALLSIKSPASSAQTFHAAHFYTPMIPSRSEGDFEYRMEKSRFRKSVDLSRKAVSRGTKSVSFHVRNVLPLRRRRDGWSRIE